MDTLEIFPSEHLSRVLCVVAHPDDMEYGGSAAVAEWTRAGVEVSYLLVTAGEAGIRHLDPETTAPLRAAEQRAACDIVGVTRLTILDFPDGLVEPGRELREAIAREIRVVRPNLVVTLNWTLEAGWGLNHIDHRVVGLAATDAIRDADNPWLFEQLRVEEGLEAWKASHLMIVGHPSPNRAVEVTEHSLEAAIASLKAHQAYLAALPDHPDPREMISSILTSGGQRSGKPLALPVRHFEM